MGSNKRNPERIAQEILDNAGISCLPIDVENVAHEHGVEIRQVSAEPSVSGALIQENNSVIIGVNGSHSEQRRRFTIAHELGHFFLHKGVQQALFVDNSTVYFRDEMSSKAIDWREIQANQFAAALLMPKDLLLKELAGKPIDVNNDEDVKKLAERCNVSAQALTLRLVNLGLMTGLPSI